MMLTAEINDPVALITTEKVYRISRAVIIESCPMIQAGIRRVLAQPCFQVSDYQEVALMSETPAAIMRLQPNLVIMELNGEGGSLLERLRMVSQMLETMRATPLIICTAVQDPRLLKQLLSLGVKGIYLKQDPLTALTQCIFQVMDGLNSYSPLAVSLLVDSIRATPLLTGREMDVLNYLLAGKNVTAIARRLHRDVRTISSHKRNAMGKLGLNNDSELYTWGAWLSRHDSSA
ncbi:response regulator transcription factor [Serratia fonticola]|uniref:LuxR C-terminal-related transcriptional regulator n=1 Tax=Serratia fonticola TaxID=47917 RepID=UPI003988005F